MQVAQKSGQALTFPAPSLSWQDAGDLFLFHRQLKNLSPATLDYYRKRLNEFFKFVEPLNQTPANFNRLTILAFIQHLRQRGWSPAAINSCLRAVRAFCRWLAAEGLRPDNPFDGVQMLKENVHLPRTLTDEQVAALLNAFNPKTFIGLRNLCFVALLLDTGLRLSEALSLELSDINWSTGMILVRHTKAKRERMVPMSPSLMQLLRRYLMMRARVTTDTNALWVTRTGSRWRSPREIQMMVKRMAAKAGIKGVKVTPHSLRFTFVRKWLQSGGDSIVLQRILGHSTPIMTSYYARLFATDLAAAHRRYSPLENLPLKWRR